MDKNSVTNLFNKKYISGNRKGIIIVIQIIVLIFSCFEKEIWKVRIEN